MRGKEGMSFSPSPSQGILTALSHPGRAKPGPKAIEVNLNHILG